MKNLSSSNFFYGIATAISLAKLLLAPQFLNLFKAHLNGIKYLKKAGILAG